MVGTASGCCLYSGDVDIKYLGILNLVLSKSLAGYYARWSVLRKLLHEFLIAGKNNDSEKPKQILSLGAGFDTTFFQLQVSPLIQLLSLST